MPKLPAFRTLTATAMAALLSLTAAAPAYAGHDWDDDHHHWRGGDDHHYWRKHHKYWRHPHNRVVVSNYYYRPAPVYTYPVSYAAPARMRTIDCEDSYNPLPALLGGAAGGVVGSKIGKGHGRTAAIIGGALVGGMVMNQYTSYDRRCTQQVFESIPVGTPVQWANNDTDYSYTVTPMRDYRTEGRYCREYQARATVGSRIQETYGTACMQPDGSWEIVN